MGQAAGVTNIFLGVMPASHVCDFAHAQAIQEFQITTQGNGLYAWQTLDFKVQMAQAHCLRFDALGAAAVHAHAQTSVLTLQPTSPGSVQLHAQLWRWRRLLRVCVLDEQPSGEEQTHHQPLVSAGS